MVVSPAHHPNWDLVADVVNTCSRVYRSAKQCKNRYENVIIPREEGRILYDINPRKQSKKTKGIYKVSWGYQVWSETTSDFEIKVKIKIKKYILISSIQAALYFYVLKEIHDGKFSFK